MSFDLFLIAFKEGRSVSTDPSAARRLIDGLQHRSDLEAGYYDVQFADGSHVELRAEGLRGEASFNGAMVMLRSFSFSPSVTQFIRDFAAAARLVIVAVDPPVTLLPFDDLRADLPADLLESRQAITISDGQELGRVLSGGFDQWKAYRDKIVEDAQQKTS